MDTKLKFNELPEDEQNILNQIYGVRKQKTIESVEELNEEEKFFFKKDNLISPSFFVQKLYKIKGNLIPLRFNLAVSKLFEANEALRVNYCAVGERTLKINFAYSMELPQIVYRNLENSPDIDQALKNILEADMRQKIDLRHDDLIKFSVFHTGEEEYAVLVTIAKFIEGYFDAHNFFRQVMNLKTVPSTKKLHFNISDTISEPIKNYWDKMLKDLPSEIVLPYLKKNTVFYAQQSYRDIIPPIITFDLREKAKSNKMMLSAILGTAWAVLLEETNKLHDVAFAMLMPSKSIDNINMMPVRFQYKDDESLKNLINRQFKQLIISQPYACLQLMQPQGFKFDHFLNFTDFFHDASLYSNTEALPEGQLVVKNSWDTRNATLGVYFYYNDEQISFTLIYNKNKFLPNFGEHIANKFNLIIKQFLTDWNVPFEQFMNRLSERLGQEQVEEFDDKAYLRNFLSQLELLQSSSKGYIQTLLRAAKLNIYFEGDRISGDEMNKNAIFVASGKLVRSIDAGDGWYNTLDIVKEKQWVNETIFLPKRKSKMSAEVLTDKAILMKIPLDAIKEFISNNPDVKEKIFLHVLGEMEKYQRLWIQS